MVRMKSVAVFLVLIVVFVGCGGKTRTVSVPDPRRVEDTVLAEQYFRLGKLYYEDCEFGESVKSFFKSLEHERSTARRANCYIYIGANYFYLRDPASAEHFFRKAKRTNAGVRPTTLDFLQEIIQLFNSAI